MKAIFHQTMVLSHNGLVGAIKLYQLFLSPLLGQNCRFYPSCSHYAIEAIELHGGAKGGLLAIKRLCRCHPFAEGGVDPVPTINAPHQPENTQLTTQNTKQYAYDRPKSSQASGLPKKP